MGPRSTAVRSVEQDANVRQNVFLAGIAAIAGAALLMWIAGGVSAILTGGGWPRVGIGDMARVMRRLLDEPWDPARAWPRRARPAIPGPLPFYGVLLALSAASAATGLFVYGVAARAPRRSEAAWASRRDLRPLIVRGSVPKRLVLGRVGASLVAAEERQSVIVLGPTQSMKTSGFAIPAILEWQGPVIATSVKTDLIRHTIKQRGRQGRTWIYDPTESTGLKASSWTPVTLCADWGGAQRVAAWLASTANQGGSGLERGDFWYTSAEKLLGPLLYAAATSGGTISDVVRWVNTHEEQEVAAALKAAGTPEALVAAQASWRREPRHRSSVYTTAETILIAYEDPGVARSAAKCEFTARELLDGGSHTLYVAAPSHEQKRLRPLFQTLLESVINHAYDVSSRRGEALDPPLLIVLDEAANIAPLPELDTLASTASAHGIQLVSVFHDLSQIIDRYGERAATVVNNHRGKIILSGVSDTQTLEYVSRLLGDEEVIQAAVTRAATGDKSTTSSTTLRSLAPASVLRAILPGEGILVYGHLLPARLRLRPWFERRRRRFLERRA